MPFGSRDREIPGRVREWGEDPFGWAQNRIRVVRTQLSRSLILEAILYRAAGPYKSADAAPPMSVD